MDVAAPPPQAADATEVAEAEEMTVGRDEETRAHCGSAAGRVKSVELMGVPIVALIMDGQERLCLAQISSTLLKQYSYNEIHNRRVALGITCVQCTPVQLEILRRAGAMPVSSRRCGMITKREAERLCKSFLTDNSPPKLPDNFSFDVQHRCAWGCRGKFTPSRYNSSRAKCVQCVHCRMFFSPNKFIFHSHRFAESDYTQPDAANFNSWRRHLHLAQDADRADHAVHAWEDVKAMFNGGTRKRFMASAFNGQRQATIATRKSEDPAANTVVQKHASSSNHRHQKKPHRHPTTNLELGGAGTLFRYPQPQETPWLCGPHPLHSYAALAAHIQVAAAASQQQQPSPGCWFPYPAFLQHPLNAMNGGPGLVSSASEDVANAACNKNERKMPDSAFNAVQAGGYAHLTKGNPTLK